jgi:hypothetical protein
MTDLRALAAVGAGKGLGISFVPEPRTTHANRDYIT